MVYSARVITVSDRCWHGERVDEAGPAVAELLRAADYRVDGVVLVPDEQPKIEAALRTAAADDVALCVTTGGTGFAPRDVTPEATLAVCERRVPG
ncbi:MAG: molybdenum cofactor biosynthesis protein, partial [Oscillospiraceae bacterium]|nr:molybdenum cofactor biosynthesis protein [Oscillospiraceae bacterium]